MRLFYTLDDKKNPVACTLETWGTMYENPEFKRVAFDEVDGLDISTVFLGIDHNHFGGLPILFETMVFDKQGDTLFQDRYHTWDEAVKGHENTKEWVKNGCIED
jgi:hypothetical protein